MLHVKKPDMKRPNDPRYMKCPEKAHSETENR